MFGKKPNVWPGDMTTCTHEKHKLGNIIQPSIHPAALPGIDHLHQHQSTSEICKKTNSCHSINNAMQKPKQLTIVQVPNGMWVAKKKVEAKEEPPKTHTHIPTHKDTTQQKTSQRKVYSNFGNSRGRIFSKKDFCRIIFFLRKKFKKIMTKFGTFTGVHCTPSIPLADKEWQRKSYRTYLSFFSPLVLFCVVVCLFVCLSVCRTLGPYEVFSLKIKNRTLKAILFFLAVYLLNVSWKYNKIENKK